MCKLIDRKQISEQVKDRVSTEVKKLSEKGIEISRRTVAKYREGMNILSSSKRRRY